MSVLLKSLIGVAVALLVAALVVGSLGVAADDSPPRQRIVIEDHTSPGGDDRDSRDLGREQDRARQPSANADDDDAEDEPGGDDADDDAPVGPAVTDDGPGRDRSDERVRASGGGGGAGTHAGRDDDSHAGDSGDESGDDSRGGGD